MSERLERLLLDSNVIIYAVQPPYATVRQFIEDNAPSASAVSYIEAMGFHGLSELERRGLERIFGNITLLPIDQRVIDRAVELRQQRRTSLGDSIVAATALVHDLTLVTRNTNDFRWIAGLRLLNPFDEGPPPGPALTPAPG